MIILTDGEIEDEAQAIMNIKNSIHLPMSLIIIGIGQNNFPRMVNLDNAVSTQRDSKGKLLSRDNVQFLKLDDIRNMGQDVAEAALANIPD